VAWIGWTAEQWVPATAAVGGFAVAGVAVLGRLRRVAADWLLPWGAVGMAGLVAAMSATDVATRWSAGGSLCLGWALASVGLGLSADPLKWRGLREASALGGLVAGAYGLWALDLGVGQLVWVTVAAGLAIVGLGLVVSRSNPDSAWLRPVALTAVAVVAASMGLAASTWPRRDLLVATLLVAALESVAGASTLKRPVVATAAPIFACAAWIVFASEAARGSAQWFTLPVGVALLAIVELSRADRRAGGLDVAADVLTTVEWLAISVVVLPALIDTVATDIVYGFAGIALGIAIGVWAIASRVRRRLFAGAFSVLLSVFLLIGVPLTGVVSELRGAALWIATAVFGLMLLVIAGSLEQGRRALRGGYRQLQELTGDWE
jgi:hypothetical protein